MSDETLRELVKDTTGLLRELIMDQGRKVEQQLSESKVIITKIQNIELRLNSVEKELTDLKLLMAAHEAESRAEKSYYTRDESRAYEERKVGMDKVWDISIKLAGVAALILFIVDKV